MDIAATEVTTDPMRLMNCKTTKALPTEHIIMATRPPTRSHPTLDWRVIGLAMGTFLAITFVLCVAFDLIFPGQAMYESWIKLLPGFTWLTWGSFLVGLIESYAYGIYIALVFCPLYNLFSRLFWRPPGEH